MKDVKHEQVGFTFNGNDFAWALNRVEAVLKQAGLEPIGPPKVLNKDPEEAVVVYPFPTGTIFRKLEMDIDGIRVFIEPSRRY